MNDYCIDGGRIGDVLMSQTELCLQPTDSEICAMCRFSSECAGCCSKCKNTCNAHQICMLGEGHQFARLNTWHHLIKSNDNFKRLRKFL